MCPPYITISSVNATNSWRSNLLGLVYCNEDSAASASSKFNPPDETKTGGDAAAPPSELTLNGEPRYKGGDGAAAKSGEPSEAASPPPSELIQSGEPTYKGGGGAAAKSGEPSEAAAPPSESENRKRRRCTGGGSAIPASGMRGETSQSPPRTSRVESGAAALAPSGEGGRRISQP